VRQLGAPQAAAAAAALVVGQRCSPVSVTNCGLGLLGS
jgi:hypothetical protein